MDGGEEPGCGVGDARCLDGRAVAAGWDLPSDGRVTPEPVLAAAAEGDPVAVDLVDLGLAG